MVEQSMNILFLSTENPYPPDHGHHIRTYNILRRLARNNDIFFIGFAKQKEELKYNKNLQEFCKTVDVFLLPQGMFKWRLYRSLFLNFFSRIPYSAKRFLHNEAKEKIRFIIEKYNIDLVHCDMLHLGVYYNEIRSLPKVITNHNVESLRAYRWFKVEKNPLFKFYLYLQYIKLYYLEKKICPKFDKCAVVSNYDKEVLLRMCGKDNFIIIPNGVDSEYFEPNNGKIVAKSLIWTGGMNGPYNRDAVDYFLEEIFPLIQLKIPEVQVYFVGKSPTANLVEKARRDPNIKIEGYVEDVRPFVDKAAVFFAPIRSGSGTKIKILNALSQAKPVVTTSVGAEGIDITENENIMIADDPHQFAEKTVYLLENPDFAKKMGQKGRKLIEEKYDWNIIEKQMNEVYEGLRQGENLKVSKF